MRITLGTTTINEDLAWADPGGARWGGADLLRILYILHGIVINV